MSLEEVRRTTIHELLHIHTTKVREVDFIKRLVRKSVWETIDNQMRQREEKVVLKLEDVIYSILKK